MKNTKSNRRKLAQEILDKIVEELRGLKLKRMPKHGCAIAVSPIAFFGFADHIIMAFVENSKTNGVSTAIRHLPPHGCGKGDWFEIFKDGFLLQCGFDGGNFCLEFMWRGKEK